MESLERENTRSLGVIALLDDHYVDGDDDGDDDHYADGYVDGDDEHMAKISRRRLGRNKSLGCDCALRKTSTRLHVKS